ncbi:hypothetical protein CDL12_09288 [Handroanthus impetiginosus]|uniref:Uncharacterized protein n=1 Tax=Handroanthus impetiginosus TaxID=429701 RepID=A0A2G9HKH2_9LAMI|nr:hypothetical protein CDL12_09288 [Handroanthus impetiginosus]
MKRGTKDDCLDDDNFSDYIERFHKRNKNELNTEITNGRATAYSGTFHEKNSGDYSFGGYPLVLPPQPPAAFKK